MPMRRPSTFVLVLTSLVTVSTTAIFVREETQRVPIARVAGNLERELATDPRNIQTLINLARLHGMAYALKTEETEIPRSDVNGTSISWSFSDAAMTNIPRAVRTAENPRAAELAADHLRQSLAYYKQALEIEPSNSIALLGYGWALEQSGDAATAIARYRQLIDLAWKSEQTKTRAGLRQEFFTEEGAGRLIALLDPAADAAEIRELEQRRQYLQKLPRAVTPIAVPIRDGVLERDIIDGEAKVRFDADGTGFRREWTWIGRDVGWLVYDADDKGDITSALQWFGSVTFWLFWDNGYDALAALDDDGDHELAGRELQHLAMWDDRNRNGRSEAGEVQPLAAYDIAAVNCRYVPGDGRKFAALSPQGVRFTSGATRPTYDVLLEPAATTLTRH
jgi:tetratricopeptide (TPR) repeat protein